MARRRRRSKKWISRIIILILLIAAGVVVYLVWDNYFNDDKKQNAGEDSSVIVDNKDDEKPEEKPSETPEIKEKKEVIQYEGENPNTAGELTGVVTYAGIAGEKLMIRVNINQYLSSGSCELRLLYEGDVNLYSDVANIVDSASTSTCEGFDIPKSDLRSGHYLIIIEVNADGKTGIINGEVNV